MKRLYAFFGYNTIGDVHLGDWGLQMGLVIAELQERRPDLPYFDENAAEYPEEAPCTVSELEEALDFSNRAAALTCTRPGAIPAMPTLEELSGAGE